MVGNYDKLNIYPPPIHWFAQKIHRLLILSRFVDDNDLIDLRHVPQSLF